MANWIAYPLTLEGQIVDLISLDKKHFSALDALAKDKRIWEHYTYDGSNTDRFLNILSSALEERTRALGFRLLFFINQAIK